MPVSPYFTVNTENIFSLTQFLVTNQTHTFMEKYFRKWFEAKTNAP